LAKEIAERAEISERKIRSDFLRLINEKIKEAEDRGEIFGKKYGEGEDWLLVTRSLDSVFKVITCILDHNTGYKHYEKVPLEVGIGVGEYDRWARLDGSSLIIESSTIEFLKTNIIDYYRKWYKKKYLKSIKSTFVVITESVYDEMEPLDREICKKVEYEGTKCFFAVETEKVIQRGSVLKFLGKINKSAHSWYRRIERIFVSPNEYETIIGTLEKYKAVFLVGDPEIGKTYTAVRIMWEYCCKGYKPIWYSGSELEERKKIRQMMSEGNVSNNSITYFEDPFGKTKFEDREELRRTIGSFLGKIQGLDARVVITSREEVFEEFHREKLSKIDLRAFTIEMRLMKPSYSKEKMEAILNDWATDFDCKWLHEKDLKSSVITLACKTITSPLGLWDFALASRDYDDIVTIDLIIQEKSKEVKEAFAEEIAGMDKEKIIFLSLVYVLHPVTADAHARARIETIYTKKCNEFGLDSERNPFDYLVRHFMSKVSQDQHNALLYFAHPTYEEGLVLSWNRIEVRAFILKLLEGLVKEDDPVVRGSCGFCLTKSFAEISFKNEAKSLIKAVLDDKSPIARYGVALATRNFFDNIPTSLAFELIETMFIDRHREVRGEAVGLIRDNFKKIPTEESLRFISRSLEDRAAYVRLFTVELVEKYMKDLPEGLVTKALECCKELRNYSGYTLSYFANIFYVIFREKVQKLKNKRDK